MIFECLQILGFSVFFLGESEFMILDLSVIVQEVHTLYFAIGQGKILFF